MEAAIILDSRSNYKLIDQFCKDWPDMKEADQIERFQQIVEVIKGKNETRTWIESPDISRHGAVVRFDDLAQIEAPKPKGEVKRKGGRPKGSKNKPVKREDPDDGRNMSPGELARVAREVDALASKQMSQHDVLCKAIREVIKPRWNTHPTSSNGFKEFAVNKERDGYTLATDGWLEAAKAEGLPVSVVEFDVTNMAMRNNTQHWVKFR